jgi:hypothetical protein
MHASLEGYVVPSSFVKGAEWFLNNEPPIPMILFSKIFADFKNNIDTIEFGKEEVALVKKLHDEMTHTEAARVTAFKDICAPYFNFKLGSHTFKHPSDEKLLFVNIEGKPELSLG